MKFVLFLIIFSFCFSSSAKEFFDREDFNVIRGKISLKPGVNAQNYRMGAVTNHTEASNGTNAPWSSLNQRQLISSAEGQNPYILDIRSSTTSPGNYIFMEGGASADQNGRGEAELVVTEIENKQLKARTRCKVKHTRVQEANPALNSVAGNFAPFFNLNIETPLGAITSHTPRDNRELMDCTTVTPEFCQAIDSGIDSKQMRSCLSTMKKITAQNPNDWATLKAKEAQMATNWVMPFSENFFGNVNTTNKRGSRNSLDLTQLRKHTGFTDKDTNSFVNLVRDCEFFAKSPTQQQTQTVVPFPQRRPERSAAGVKDEL